MFFNLKKLLRRKIQDLLSKTYYNEMSWKDELRAAKTLEIYIELLNKEENK